MPINKEKLDLRAEVAKNRPDFKRPESWRYKRLETTWRKPKGIDNHQRKQKSRGRPGLVKVGYGGPKIARGLHPSGYTDYLVHNITDLEKLNPKYKNRFKVMLVPNITNISYGRGVGYKIEEVVLPEKIQKISATKIRAKMRDEGEIK